MRPPIRVAFSSAILLGAALGCAQFVVKVSGPSVSLNGVHVVTLHKPNAESRAQAVGRSFAKLSTNSDLSLEGTKKSCDVLDRDRVVLTATRSEAKAHGLSPKALASTWMQRLNDALSVPAVSVGVDKLRTGLGSIRKLPVEGYLSKHAKAKTDNEGVVTAGIADGQLKLTAKGLGQAVIAITAGSVTKTLAVEVLPNAMNFPQNLSVSVTGSPASATDVKAAIETAMWTQIRHNPGAQYKFRMPETEFLAAGNGRAYQISVDASCPGAISNSGLAVVSVQNEPLAFRQETALWYCNDPESITRAEELFAARLGLEKPVRMLYHHQNDSSRQLFVEVQARNESDRPARLLLMPGDASPSKDPVRAGIDAGEKLLKSWVRSSGEIITIPPRHSAMLAMRSLGYKETMSGLCYLRLLSGPPSLLVTAEAVTPYEGDSRLAAALDCSTPWRRLPPSPLSYEGEEKVELSEHVYPNPFKTESVNYTVGGRHGFVRIGQKPIVRPDGHGLDGNFGVFYTIEANLENPNNEPAEVEFVFEASAGYSGAIFVVDGVVRRAPLLQSKEEVQVARIRLRPGEQKSVSLSTVPLSGSSYPATLIVRPVGSGAMDRIKRVDH